MGSTWDVAYVASYVSSRSDPSERSHLYAVEATEAERVTVPAGSFATLQFESGDAYSWSNETLGLVRTGWDLEELESYQE